MCFPVFSCSALNLFYTASYIFQFVCINLSLICCKIFQHGNTNISAAKANKHITAVARQFASACSSTRSKGKARRLQHFMIPHAIVERRRRFSAAKCEGSARNCDTDPPRYYNKYKQALHILVLHNLQVVRGLKNKCQKALNLITILHQKYICLCCMELRRDFKSIWFIEL